MKVDEADAVAFIEQLDQEFLQLDEVVRLMQEEEDEQEQSGRQSHGREKDMWGTVWGTMLKNPDLNDPKHWVHRNFVRRFRLPYQLFKQLVVECKEVNLFEQKRKGKNPLEFKILIGLRILARDSCADDLDELLNIGGSTINHIFKQFMTGMATKLYDRHVHVPEGAELDKIVETSTRHFLEICTANGVETIWDACQRWPRLLLAKVDRGITTCLFPEALFEHNRRTAYERQQREAALSAAVLIFSVPNGVFATIVTFVQGEGESTFQAWTTMLTDDLPVKTIIQHHKCP
ncbi:hypothetical protein B484DRAFT_435615, partial [Ochromonadaceae sp. CCMP2298]